MLILKKEKIKANTVTKEKVLPMVVHQELNSVSCPKKTTHGRNQRNRKRHTMRQTLSSLKWVVALETSKQAMVEDIANNSNINNKIDMQEANKTTIKVTVALHNINSSSSSQPGLKILTLPNHVKQTLVSKDQQQDQDHLLQSSIQATHLVASHQSPSDMFWD